MFVAFVVVFIAEAFERPEWANLVRDVLQNSRWTGVTDLIAPFRRREKCRRRPHPHLIIGTKFGRALAECWMRDFLQTA